MAKESMKLVANNKKAYHDYFVDEKYEAGLVLHGTEVKSLRMGKCSLKESFIRIEHNELFVYNMHISPYEKGNIFNREPRRERKLLMNKREIIRICGQVEQKGLTLVPLSLYFSGKNVKVELGLCRGKKLYDKRDSLAEKQANREMDRRMKDSARYDD